MKKTVTAKQNANEQVVLLLTSNKKKISNIPVMSTQFTRLKKLVTDTNSLISQVGNIPSKTAGNKSQAKTSLVDASAKVSNILKVYAYATKNENLSNFIVTSGSMLTTRMRNLELLHYSKNLLERITSYGDSLVDYGMTDELKTELTSLISSYDSLMAEPRQLISSRKTTNELIDDNIDEISDLLSNEIDPMMELFIDDTEFYLSYKAARMIVDPASHKKETTSETAEAIEE